tara:strand:+ start:1480 stop:2118 length:639 start_codon:yes stop_codon:yes gene_type:complete
MKIRSSALGKIMTNPRKKTELLSATCKTYIKELVKEDLFGYKSTIDSKYLTKGIDMEDTSIDLYNEVHGTLYLKNTERLSNEFITGECDINAEDKIIDIKSSWSLETFPASPEDVNNKDYEWQLRGYMMLYNKPKAELAYCMVSTPDYLLKEWDNWDIHKVDSHDPFLRVTTISFERDRDKEREIMDRVIECGKFYIEYRDSILNKQLILSE